MSDFIKFSVDTVLYSIVNPKNLITFLDSTNPYSFNDFLKYTNENYSPTIYNDFYLFYINAWYEAKNNTTVGQQDFVVQQYINLIKEISLTYTTNDEKRFLSNIDFNSLDDLEIVIPFYSAKIKDIVLYFKNIRDTTNYSYRDFKQKGTVNNIANTFKRNILDSLFNNQVVISSNLKYDSIKNNIEIEIEDLVDTFGEYLNLNAGPTLNETDLRTQYYTANYNKIDSNVFLNFNKVLMDSIFSNIFIKQLGTNFKINTNLTYDPFCAPDSSLGKLIKSKTIGDVTPTDKILLQQRVLEKYMGVDLYYITRDTSGAVLSGLLIKALNPSGNFVNVTNPSTATVPAYEYTALKKLGLYFRPDSIGLLKFDTRKKSFSINADVVKTNVVYIYPDPDIYGSVQYTFDSPIVYDIDFKDDIKYVSSTFNYGDPKIETKDQPFYSYFSRQQQKNSNINNNVYPDFSSVANKGFIYDWKTDIYGNQYALFKSGYLRNIQDPSTITSSIVNNTGIVSPATNTNAFNTIVQGSSTIFSSITANDQYLDPIYKHNLTGSLFVRNTLTSQVSALSSALYTTFSKYSNNIQTDIYNNVRSLDVVYDTIAIETPNYYVIEKINFDETGFLKSTKNNTYVSINSAAPFEVLSNRVFVESKNKFYFFITKLYSGGTTNYLPTDYSKIVYPEIYCYDIASASLEKIYPRKDEEITNYKDIFSHDILFNNADLNSSSINLVQLLTPTISYNSYNNLFSISYVCKDLNNSPYIFYYNFNLEHVDIEFLNSRMYFTNNQNLDPRITATFGYFKLTNNFYSLSSTEATVISPTVFPLDYISDKDRLNFNSVLDSVAIINNIGGYIQL